MVFRKLACSLLVWAGAAVVATAQAGVVFKERDDPGQLTGGVYRWDAAPRTIDGNERSLVGGLRYAMSGGGYQGFRDQFKWDSTPSVLDFTATVQNAFAAWASPDPVSGLLSGLSFVHDANTAVAGRIGGGGANSDGAEIDLIATTSASFWVVGNTRTQGESWFNGIGGIGSTVTLTSGVANYTHSRAISGADIYLNSNAGAVYTLDFFGRLLTHEIGHALGLGDIENSINPGRFIDDNFNANDIAGTMNNAWAAMVNPLDPSASVGLALYNIGGAAGAPGVNLLMESAGLGIDAGNPVSNLVPLTNDEYGTRQFLYPMLAVPEPATWAMGSLGLLAVLALARRRSRAASAG